MNTEDTPATKFAKDVSRRNHLAAILMDPVLQEALDIAEDQMGPQTGTQADAVPAVAAAKFHQMAGANELVKKLHALTREPAKQTSPKLRSFARTLEDLPKDA
jgi:hypothetical protein